MLTPCGDSSSVTSAARLDSTPYTSPTEAFNQPNSTMDMDTECPGLPVQKYVDAVEDMELVPKFPRLQAREVPLSPFERLPLELRQGIYRYLGVPIVRKPWLYSTGPTTISRFTFSHWDDNAVVNSQYGSAGTTFDWYHTCSGDDCRYGLKFISVSSRFNQI
jgi:hypothetical protein